jgi:hypothetical protein
VAPVITMCLRSFAMRGSVASNLPGLGYCPGHEGNSGRGLGDGGRPAAGRSRRSGAGATRSAHRRANHVGQPGGPPSEGGALPSAARSFSDPRPRMRRHDRAGGERGSRLPRRRPRDGAPFRRRLRRESRGRRRIRHPHPRSPFRRGGGGLPRDVPHGVPQHLPPRRSAARCDGSDSRRRKRCRNLRHSALPRRGRPRARHRRFAREGEAMRRGRERRSRSITRRSRSPKSCARPPAGWEST